MSKITFNGFGSKSPLFDEYALEDFKELVSLPLTPGDNDKYLYEQTAGWGHYEEFAIPKQDK